ncbi:unnamed protein product [Ranitomeya imitator]|uniref:Helix-turn-helix domain-containing protein n=1 Tax=Ranitomeya imitator TaxID=111125 RepID=A0ABN9LQA2_9NEOB|nr:unnamed protein product [Ranitomeya imitator]
MTPRKSMAPNNISETSILLAKESLKRLEQLLLKEMRDLWEVVTLERYLAFDCTPKGLIIHKTLTGDIGDENTLKEWDLLLKSFSKQAIAFIINKRRDQLMSSKNEISKLFKEIDPYKNHPEIRNLSNSIKNRVNNKEKEIIEKKKWKFGRDSVPSFEIRQQISTPEFETIDQIDSSSFSTNTSEEIFSIHLTPVTNNAQQTLEVNNTQAHMEHQRNVIGDIKEVSEKKCSKFRYNLVKNERDAIRSLQQKEGIIISPADKGGDIVVLDQSQYRIETQRLLGDARTYMKLTSDPSAKFTEDLKHLLNKSLDEGHINKQEFEYIYTPHPRMSVFYYLPKIHKDIKHPPGRPIISGIGNLTSNLSHHVDCFLQDIVPSLPAYLKDTKHILQILGNLQWQNHYILGILDIASLYTVIQHDKGTEAMGHFLNKSQNLSENKVNFIKECATFILTHNFFKNETDYYTQQWGTAMGTRFAPSYANLYIGRWEELHIYLEGVLRAGLALRLRFIDDIFFIWEGREEDLKDFLTDLNKNEFYLLFTAHTSKERVQFLDLNITVSEGILQTSTYTKPTDSNSFISMSSCHLPRWLLNVPRSQLIRANRNCTNSADYDKEADAMIQKFLNKGYEQESLLMTKRDVQKIPRIKLLEENAKIKDKDNITKDSSPSDLQAP